MVPPTVLKLYATGKGVAPKETMMLECFKRWGYSATDNNDCDAFCLARLGMDWCARQDGDALPKRLVEVLAKLEAWGPAGAATIEALAPKAKGRRSSTPATAA